MTTTLRILITALILFSASSISAQNAVTGLWMIDEVRGSETPEAISFSITFEDEGKAIVSYETGEGAAQTWHFAYTVKGNKLTLKPTTAPGEPDARTYEMRFSDTKLELLTPLPEPVEGEPTPEDNRQPVWVLSRK